ncbi:MAG: ABC transporter permease [Kordiimonadaceae bacterium]|nr:ABC transporter permease [Kordiimonadaceae bacterium]
MLLNNYLISAWRNIFKHKLFSAINIFGLAIGLAACILIALFVRDELSYDKFWSKADQIYRTHITFSVPGRDPMDMVMTPGPVIHALLKDFPQVEHASRLASQEPTIIINNHYFVDDISLVDEDFINIFDLEAVEGDLNTALKSLNNIVLTEKLAKKYFGSNNAIGKIITIDFDSYKRDYKVAAVIKDMAKNSQVITDALVAIDEPAWKEKDWMFDAWFSVNSHMFFTLKKGADIKSINNSWSEFIDRNFPKLPFGGTGAKTSDFVHMTSMSIKDLHLKAKGDGEYHEIGDMNTVIIFSTVAFLILIIAAINFMNLSTARASSRAKEVSLRKVLGASRKDLIIQFLGESILITAIGMIMAIVFVEFALPIYNEILGKTLRINYASADLIYVAALAIFVGLLGGSYPAFILSHFRPSETLKANKSAESDASIKLRSILVIVQFAVSITLFVSTAVVYGQMLYAKNMNLGYDKENILAVKEVYRDVVLKKLPLLVDEIRRMPNAISVTWSNFMPESGNNNNTLVRTEKQALEDASLIGSREIGFDYFKTYKVPLISGREYSIERGDREVLTDDLRKGLNYTGSIIVNESALRRLGLGTADNAIGKLVFISKGNPSENLEATYEIIGVVPDIHFDSLKSTIRPEIYDLSVNYGSVISARFSGSPVAFTEQVRKLWEQEIPSIPFNYDFISAAVAKQYNAEQGQAAMFAAFSCLAILVACLGLYGLASYTAERRTKEIGIRKVMGASVFDVVKLLIWQFSKPVLIANLIAWPISYFTMTLWLESFVYRIEDFFILGFCLLAAFTALIIAWSTVAGNSMRVARANPIKALRYE